MARKKIIDSEIIDSEIIDMMGSLQNMQEFLLQKQLVKEYIQFVSEKNSQVLKEEGYVSLTDMGLLLAARFGMEHKHKEI